MWFLIENNSQKIFEFKTKKELREFAKKHNLKIKKSPISNFTYYTEGYVELPTGFSD